MYFDLISIPATHSSCGGKGVSLMITKVPQPHGKKMNYEIHVIKDNKQVTPLNAYIEHPKKNKEIFTNSG